MLSGTIINQCNSAMCVNFHDPVALVLASEDTLTFTPTPCYD